MPLLKILFPDNAAAFLSAILYYVGKVCRLFGKDKNNKGFFLYVTNNR
jgi:hypothetical protein